MKSTLSTLIDFFIPEKLQCPKEVYWRARIMASIHIFLLAVVVSSGLLISVLFVDNQFPSFFSFIAISLLLFGFKKWGSFVISGNLIVLFLVLVLFPFSLTTGGIYSYDFIVLFIAPLLAFLLVGRNYGFFWMGILVVLNFATFYLEQQSLLSYREQIKDYNATYYLILTMFIQITTVACVAIFDKGQRLIVDELNYQRNLLNKGKAELEKKEAELLESNANLKHFAHVASHDLKQPIRSICSFGEILKRDLGENLSKDHKVYLDFMISGAKQLQSQVDSVMEHAKIGGSELTNVETIETLHFVENVLLKLQKQIIDSETKMTIKKLPTEIVASKIELGLVFQNIISNAIKFKKPESPLEINISCQEQSDHFEFRIADNGVGVEQDIINKIFTPMVKSYSKQNSSGTGMGLATCEKIIKRHKGSIRVESERGAGATFIFTISKALQPEKIVMEVGREELVG